MRGLDAAELGLLRAVLRTCRASGVPRAQWSVVLGALALGLEAAEIAERSPRPVTPT